MAKAMTKSEVASHLAEKVGITKKQVAAFFEAQADLAYKQAKNTFVLPGICKVVLVEKQAHDRMLQFPPERKGQIVHVPKSKKIKFRAVKAAKDAILGPKK